MILIWIYLAQIISSFVGVYFLFRKEPVFNTSDMKMFALALVPIIGFIVPVLICIFYVSEYCAFRVWKNPFYRGDKK